MFLFSIQNSDLEAECQEHGITQLRLLFLSQKKFSFSTELYYVDLFLAWTGLQLFAKSSQSFMEKLLLATN